MPESHAWAHGQSASASAVSALSRADPDLFRTDSTMLRNLISNSALIAVVTLCAPLLGLSASAVAETRGDPEAGKEAAQTCIACHGQQGKGIGPEYPNLGGQHYSYLLKQMRAFKAGDRNATLMAGQLDGKSDEQIRDIAAFYAEQPTAEGVAEADDDVLELGEQIYRAGLPDKGVAACIACHSPSGQGNGPAGFPALTGQPAEYTKLQLKAYRSGERTTGSDMGNMMQGIVQDMTAQEIEAVAEYIRGLH